MGGRMDGDREARQATQQQGAAGEEVLSRSEEAPQDAKAREGHWEKHPEAEREAPETGPGRGMSHTASSAPQEAAVIALGLTKSQNRVDIEIHIYNIYISLKKKGEQEKPTNPNALDTKGCQRLWHKLLATTLANNS